MCEESTCDGCKILASFEPPPWYRELARGVPDATTQAIMRIDRELARKEVVA